MEIIINTSIKPHFSIILNKKAKTFFLKEDNSSGETLLPAIKQELTLLKKNYSDISTIGICIGPGSFTGTRVAVATAFALSFANKTRLIKFNLLEIFGEDKDAIIMANGGKFYVKENGRIFFGMVENFENFYSFDFENLTSNKIDLIKFETEVFLKKLEKNQFSKPSECEPLYVQNSQAENLILNKCEILKATTEHLKDVFEIENECFENNKLSFESLKDEIENKEYFVAVLQEKVVGFVGFSLFKPEAEIIQIAVRPNFRKMGIATKLFCEGVKQLKVEKVFLEVNKNNNGAINLYKKLGFKEISERKNYYDNGDDALVFENKL